MPLKQPLMPPVVATSGTIDDVVEELTKVVDWSRAHRSRLGYFAALYRRVTLQVRDGIRRGLFEDGARMERFDVIFANRYLRALSDAQSGKRACDVWAFAFEHADRYWPLVLQHLLLGMNAHINLDLGIAAAETMKGQPLEALHSDFNRINGILASLVDEVQKELGRVWKMLQLFNVILGSADNVLIEFSMQKARDEAWQSAERFAATADSDWLAAVRRQDEKMMGIAKRVRYPGILLGSVTHFVRLGEVQDGAMVIDILK